MQRMLAKLGALVVHEYSPMVADLSGQISEFRHLHVLEWTWANGFVHADAGDNGELFEME